MDENGRQRFLVSTTKPVALVDGTEIQRDGPDGTYLIYNDQNGSEKGGIIATDEGAAITLDYPTGDAVHLEAEWSGRFGGARLALNHMPEPRRRAIELFCHTDEGAGLRICDSQGRPRIVLRVDASDQVGIHVLDADGNTVTDLIAT